MIRKISLILLILCPLFYQGVTFAQKEVKTLHFVYIAHEPTTPVARLTERLEVLYEQAERSKEYSKYLDAYIFYMSNNEKPYVVTLNLPNDNNIEYEVLKAELNGSKTSHNVELSTDIDSIIKIFHKYDFVDEKGNLKYESVTFDFYVGEEFWIHQYNESLIARLYWVMELNKLKEEEFIWNVYCNEQLEKELEFESQPFGIKNLSDINNDETKTIVSY